MFHELAENFYRTHGGVDYLGGSGAHQLAINREKLWHGLSLKPGDISKINGLKRPTEAVLKEYSIKIKNYMNK